MINFTISDDDRLMRISFGIDEEIIKLFLEAKKDEDIKPFLFTFKIAMRELMKDSPLETASKDEK